MASTTSFGSGRAFGSCRQHRTRAHTVRVQYRAQLRVGHSWTRSAPVEVSPTSHQLLTWQQRARSLRCRTASSILEGVEGRGVVAEDDRPIERPLRLPTLPVLDPSTIEQIPESAPVAAMEAMERRMAKLDPSTSESSTADPSTTTITAIERRIAQLQVVQPASDPEAAPGPQTVVESMFQVGDVVTGKVVFANAKGARVEVLQQPGVIGYVPARMVSQSAAHAATGSPWKPVLSLGFMRDFKVINIPEQMQLHGRGPLLSATAVDAPLMWERARQMRDACQAGGVCYESKVVSANRGGLVVALEGASLPLGFIPYSKLAKRAPAGCPWDAEVASRELTGETLYVCVDEVDEDARRFVCNHRAAAAQMAAAQLQLGQLVWGSVERIQSHSVVVGLDVGVRAVLHQDHITQGHLPRLETIFRTGERVLSVVVRAGEGPDSVAVSTAWLEHTPGALLMGKSLVFAAAQQREEEIRDMVLTAAYEHQQQMLVAQLAAEQQQQQRQQQQPDAA